MTVELSPSLVDFMMTVTAKLRWDEQGTMPQTQVSLPSTSGCLRLGADEPDLPSLLEIDTARVWIPRRA